MALAAIRQRLSTSYTSVRVKRQHASMPNTRFTRRRVLFAVRLREDTMFRHHHDKHTALDATRAGRAKVHGIVVHLVR